MTRKIYQQAVSSRFQSEPGQISITLRGLDTENLDDLVRQLRKDLIQPLRQIFKGNCTLRGVLSLDRKGERWPHAHLTLRGPEHQLETYDVDLLRAALWIRSKRSSSVIKPGGIEINRIFDLPGWSTYQAGHLSPEDDRSIFWSCGYRPKEARPAWQEF